MIGLQRLKNKIDEILRFVKKTENDVHVIKEQLFDLEKEVKRQNGKYLNDDDIDNFSEMSISKNASDKIVEVVTDDLDISRNKFDVLAVKAPFEVYVRKKNTEADES